MYDALLWFVLLVLRNVEALMPAYRALPAAAVLLVWAAYFAVIRVLSHPEMLADVGWLASPRG